jgi:hypothetical protein
LAGLVHQFTARFDRYILLNPGNLNNIVGKQRMMTHRSNDSCTKDSSDPVTDGFFDDNPPKKQWRLLVKNYSAAWRAQFAAKAQLS